MIKKIGLILFVLLALLSAEFKQTTGLESLLIGADAMGRGGTYMANDDSNHYVFQNYSFLSQSVSPRISMTVFKLLSELNYLAAAYSQNNFSVGFLNMSDSGGYVRDGINNVVGGKINYSDTTLYGAYAWQMFDKYDLGARLKYVQKSLSQVDVTAWGMALDLAGAFEFNNYWTFGAELNNLVGTPLQWSNDYSEKFPLSLGLGAKFKAFGPDGAWSNWFDQRVDFYGDLRLEEYGSFMTAGAEYWLGDHVALRAGINQTYTVDKDNEPDRYTKFVAGVGFNWLGFYFDYAYNPGDDIADNITHFFTIAYRFGEKKKPAEPTEDAVVIPPPAVVPTVLRKRLFTDTVHLSLKEQVLLEDVGFLGFMVGYGSGIFEPEQALTRRELLLIITRLLEREGQDPRGALKYFPDINEADLNKIRKAVNSDILRGYPDGLAKVQRPVRRDEAAGIFARYAGISGRQISATLNTYTDVPVSHWAYKDINLTKQYNLTEGNLYRPREYMLRLDAAWILSRMSLVQQLRPGLPPIEGLTYSGPLDNVIYVTPSYNYAPMIYPVGETRQSVPQSQPAVRYNYQPSRKLSEPKKEPAKKLVTEDDIYADYRAELDKLQDEGSTMYDGSAKTQEELEADLEAEMNRLIETGRREEY